MTALPSHLEEIRTRVVVEPLAPKFTATIEDPDAFRACGVDNSMLLERFREVAAVRVLSVDEEEIKFDLTGVEAAFANAVRRILLSEVPTFAVDRVNIYQNTSIVQDEVLAHRIGLVPMLVDARRLDAPREDGQMTSKNTLVFTLKKKCELAPARGAGKDRVIINEHVYSSDIKWAPQGRQAEQFQEVPIRPVHDDILLARLRPGQEIELECFAIKGTGRIHAKWSPVATAMYRLLPEIVLEEPFEGAEADALVACCPRNVFDIEDFGRRRVAKVARPRDCTMCRECIREEPRAQKIKLRRVKQHFEFNIESVGMFKPHELLPEALNVLRQKCHTLLGALDKVEAEAAAARAAIGGAASL